MTNDALKPYLFDAFYRCATLNQSDIYLEFDTNQTGIVIPESFKSKKRIRLKLGVKSCFDIKIHTNGLTFYIIQAKQRQDIFIPQESWIAIYSEGKVLDFADMQVKEKVLKMPEAPITPFKLSLAWDADKIRNESVNKG